MPLYLGRSTSILFRTLPYVILRMLLYLAFGILFVLYWVLVYFIGQAGAVLHPYVRVAIWITAFILSFPVVRLFKEYFLYVLKIGHVAVITRLALYNSLPEGVGQIEWGKEQVMKRFRETSVLFVVDRLVAGVIRSIHGMVTRIGNIFSGVPGMGGLVTLTNAVLRFSLTYVDEAVMARNFMKPEETVWQSAKTGLVLYAQSWKEVLKISLVLGLGSLTSYVILLIFLLIPLLGLGKVYPSFKAVFVIAAFVFAGVIKMALFDPWALTTMIVAYLEETRDKTADRSWEEKLEVVSSKFREIKQKVLAEKPVSMPAP